MQGRQDPQRELFCTINLEEFIPKDHLLYRLDKVVDFDFIYALTEELYCPDNGRSSIDPVLYFRMQLIAYLYGITADRELCREIHLNLAYRWFCRLRLQDQVPDHSSLTRIRDRFGEDTFRQIFEQLIERWRQSGLIKGRRVIADASLVQADASMDSMVKREDGDPQARALRQYEKRYAHFNEGKKQRKVANQTHVSQSDPDATLVARAGSFGKLLYKAHVSADADSRLITDCHATTGSRHEATVLPDRLDYQIDRLGLPLEEVVADRGYGRGPTYTDLRSRGIRHYIPLHDGRTGAGKLTPKAFRYDRRRDRYICPEGHALYPYDKWDHGILKRYRVVGGHCRPCPRRSQCLPDTQKHRARFVYRSPHQDEINRVRKRQTTHHFKRRQAERRWKIEGLFAEGKQYHNLRRARYRGLSKVQIQFFLVAIALNCKRAVNALYLLFNILVRIFGQRFEKNLIPPHSSQRQTLATHLSPA